MGFYKNNTIGRLFKRIPWLWGLLIGILFLGIGIAGGQFAVIWRKAAMICMECIGIG